MDSEPEVCLLMDPATISVSFFTSLVANGLTDFLKHRRGHSPHQSSVLDSLIKQAIEQVNDSFVWHGPLTVQEVGLFILSDEVALLFQEVYSLDLSADQGLDIDLIRGRFIGKFAVHSELPRSDVEVPAGHLFDFLVSQCNYALQAAAAAGSLPAQQTLSALRDRLQYNRIGSLSDKLDALVDALPAAIRAATIEQTSTSIARLTARSVDGDNVPYPNSLTVSRVTRLLAILDHSDLLAENVLTFYSRSLPITSAPLAMASTMSDAVHHLADLPRQTPDGAYPLMAFVQRLIAHTRTSAVVKALVDWSDAAAEELGMTRGDLDALQQEVARVDTPASQYLQIEIAPDELDEKFCAVTAWLGFNNKFPPKLIYQDESRHHIKNAPDVIGCILSGCVYNTWVKNKWPDMAGRLTIEFILPMELINCEVDQWPCKSGHFTSTLGEHHAVVVRLQDRSGGGVLGPDAMEWEGKWARLQSTPNTLCEHSVFWATQSLCGDSESLYRDLRARDDAVCVGFVTVPTLPTHGEPNVLYAVLDAGFPIALWPRHSRHLDLRGALEPHLNGVRVQDLPQSIRQLRRTSISNGCPPWDHLTLYWDDPERNPCHLHLGYSEGHS